MVRDEAADLGGILQPALVKPTILIAAGWRVALGLGVTQQHQTAHWRILDSVSARLRYSSLLRTR
jgi:hypothetical protein